MDIFYRFAYLHKVQTWTTAPQSYLTVIPFLPSRMWVISGHDKFNHQYKPLQTFWQTQTFDICFYSNFRSFLGKSSYCFVVRICQCVNQWNQFEERLDMLKKISDLPNEKFWNFWIPEIYLLNSVKFVFLQIFSKGIVKKNTQLGPQTRYMRCL